MSIVMWILVPLYVIVCIFLILVVLLQQGKSDVAAAFGASSTQTTFGARGATTLLEKITTWCFVGFCVMAVAISLVQSRGPGSVMRGAPTAKKSSPPPAKAATTAPAPAAPAPATSAPAPAPATK